MVKELLNYLQVHEGLLEGGYSHVVLLMHRGPKEEIDLFHLKKIVLNAEIDYQGMSWDLHFWKYFKRAAADGYLLKGLNVWPHESDRQNCRPCSFFHLYNKIFLTFIETYQAYPRYLIGNPLTIWYNHSLSCIVS